MAGIPFEQFLVQTVNGLVSGMILALVASGLTLIFGIMDVVNFAHGDLLMLGAFVGSGVFMSSGNFWAALLAAVVVVAVLGALLQVTTLRPLLGRDPLTTILATFGISLVLQNYALWQWGPSARNIAEPIGGQFQLLYLQYPVYRIAIALLSGAIIGGLWLFMKYGKYGIWIRATTQDRVMASAMGIPVPAVHATVFAIGAGMAAASGVLFAPLVGVTQTIGLDFTLRASSRANALLIRAQCPAAAFAPVDEPVSRATSLPNVPVFIPAPTGTAVDSLISLAFYLGGEAEATETARN